VSHFDSPASWTALLLPDEDLEKQKRNWPGDQENRHIDPDTPKTEFENAAKRCLLCAQFFWLKAPPVVGASTAPTSTASNTDIPDHSTDVRFTPKSGHRSVRLGCPLCANSGHQPPCSLPPRPRLPRMKSGHANCFVCDYSIATGCPTMMLRGDWVGMTSVIANPPLLRRSWNSSRVRSNAP
jgi:hypothetical protein